MGVKTPISGQPSMRGMFWAKMTPKTVIFLCFEAFSSKMAASRVFPLEKPPNWGPKVGFWPKIEYFPGGGPGNRKNAFFQGADSGRKSPKLPKVYGNPPPAGDFGGFWPRSIKNRLNWPKIDQKPSNNRVFIQKPVIKRIETSIALRYT